MSRRYSIAEARARLPGIIDEAAEGPVELTRRGRPVAVVISPALYALLEARRPSFTDAFAAFLERRPPAPEAGLRKADLAGLRSRETGRAVDP